MIIVKIGGGDSININGIIADLAGLDDPFIIVHGANALRDKLAQDLGQPKQVLNSVNRINVPVKSHTSTFGGNPTACAAALATIDVIEKEGLVENAQTLGE
jgi:hypothetical protein